MSKTLKPQRKIKIDFPEWKPKKNFERSFVKVKTIRFSEPMTDLDYKNGLSSIVNAWLEENEINRRDLIDIKFNVLNPEKVDGVVMLAHIIYV